ncbi:MAG: hypothetical protein COW73_02940 [Nitrospirae bacterium CG18_big_fil_WC_8_21_14_2_50_70_55]|nr:response regulator [Deltaproteobacteria bacterium]OIP63281.1 MAG: hypothetical protein AUK30_08710 [Nitrospirae bacterium CG2_30_70_394]PIQ06647.1 MAG: hypothetical protein COW73_02940 [Nitrospirae bacterium CG18_big_fil_WC_8_21_14_2_50_70_55]PIU78429.1 MAG: hypothetical protein COS73_07250 [Nitrospirae bacterium CG06_land_8_20_14_3_00_70_43]PIW84042.1 MAG: hypothetical protein COZ96_00230 [Nitrospirae bacterium CG_4_8_14_3_um_filter_70_85]PIX84173.1 MAG: hypothetical protein COZ33_01635 [N
MFTPPPPCILIVEDDEAMLALMERFLRRGGYTTATTVTAEAALTAIAESAPSLVIVDYMLPGEMNGLELIDHLQKCHPEIPTLFISAFGSPDLCRTARNGGATDCLIKPFNMVTLMERVATLLARPDTTPPA